LDISSRSGARPEATKTGGKAMKQQVDDITVHYETFGQGRPIVLLHGWTLDHRHMVTEMEPVFVEREGWQRFYPDLPGHGQTPATERIARQDDILEVVLGFIEQVIPGQRFVVGGMSAGALLARGVVYHRAAKVDGLLLTAPVVVAEDARRTVPEPVTLVKDPELLSELGEDEAQALQGAVVQCRELLEALNRDYAPASEAGDQELLGQIRQDPQRYALSFDVDALAELFPAPTLILTGRQDASVGYRDAWKILENYPRATFAVIDRAGHLLAVDQQRLFRALVSEWLDRVEEYAEKSKEG
jgi:pimeloyl-ACP methyl ester carboxylesterase